MDTRMNPPIHRSAPEKRAQKHLHFSLQPEDEELIAQLPAPQQAALRSEGSYAERAQQMGVAIGTVRSRLHRARAALVKLRAERAQGGTGKPGSEPGSEDDSRDDSAIH